MRPKPAPLSLAQVCELLGVTPSSSSTATLFSGLNTLELATPTDISFFFRPNMRREALKCKAGLILIPEALDFQDPRALVVPNVWTAILKLINYFSPSKPVVPGIHPTAVIHESAMLGANVSIGPYVVVGEGATIGDLTRLESHCSIGDYVSIGSNCHFYPRVSIYDDCQVGDRVIIHSGTVVGSDGFKYEFLNGRLTKIPQIGNVVIENDVEIGSNCTIDRAGFSETRIGARCKLDNMVHIAHNVTLGSDCIIAGQSGVAGSSTLGRGVIIAGQVGVGDHTTVGDGTKIGAKAGLKGNFGPGLELLGSPAIDVREFLRIYTATRKLPKALEKLRPLLDQLEAEAKD